MTFIFVHSTFYPSPYLLFSLLFVASPFPWPLSDFLRSFTLPCPIIFFRSLLFLRHVSLFLTFFLFILSFTFSHSSPFSILSSLFSLPCHSSFTLIPISLIACRPCSSFPPSFPVFLSCRLRVTYP